MTTTKEILHQAGLAAGYILGEWNDGTEAYSSGEGFVMPSNTIWNPLTNHGDAFALAVDLRLTVDMTDCNCCIDVYSNELDGDGPDTSIRHSADYSDCETTDPHAAARMAIVRTAALIYQSKTDTKL